MKQSRQSALSRLGGLSSHWPTARRDTRGRVNVESAVDNYPVQALATAEIVPVAVVYLWHRLAENGLQDRVRIVNLVHDSAPSEIHPSAAEEFKELAKQSFTHDVYKLPVESLRPGIRQSAPRYRSKDRRALGRRARRGMGHFTEMAVKLSANDPHSKQTNWNGQTIKQGRGGCV
jgi:hypothetical protein